MRREFSMAKRGKTRERGFDVRIRLATNEDAQDVVGFLRNAGVGKDLEVGIRFDEDDLGDIVGHYSERGGFVAMVEVDYELVGTFALYPLDSRTCELRKFCLLPVVRESGNGALILKYFLNIARDLGYGTVELETHSHLLDANALYARFGFRPISKRPRQAGADLVLGRHIDNPQTKRS